MLAAKEAALLGSSAGSAAFTAALWLAFADFIFDEPVGSAVEGRSSALCTLAFFWKGAASAVDDFAWRLPFVVIFSAWQFSLAVSLIKLSMCACQRAFCHVRI